MSTTGQGAGYQESVAFQCEDGFAPFVGRRDVAVYQNAAGEIRTLRTHSTHWPSLYERHLRGVQRLGLFPTLQGRCRFGVIDLDAHDESTPDRHPDGLELLNFLDRRRITAYLETSRGGRGAHIWMFFEAPGVPAQDLHSFLDALASELRALGPVDIFPRSPAGWGGAILLPYFGGADNVRDPDLKLVPRDKLEPNSVGVIPVVAIRKWPPTHWKVNSPWEGSAREFQANVAELRAAGLVFERAGGLQARSGARNQIAGAVARRILRKGGSYEDFKRWDTANEPPLASNEPKALIGWWEWAIRHEQRGKLKK